MIVFVENDLWVIAHYNPYVGDKEIPYTLSQ